MTLTSGSNRTTVAPAASPDAGLLRFMPPPAAVVGDVPVPRDTSLSAERTRAVLDAEPPSLLDTLRGLATERRIADARIAETPPGEGAPRPWTLLLRS